MSSTQAVTRPIAVRPVRRYTFAAEVIGPDIAPRVKKAADFATIGVDASEIRALVQIAVRACECQVTFEGDAAMLARENVFDVKGE